MKVVPLAATKTVRSADHHSTAVHVSTLIRLAHQAMRRNQRTIHLADRVRSRLAAAPAPLLGTAPQNGLPNVRLMIFLAAFRAALGHEARKVALWAAHQAYLALPQR